MTSQIDVSVEADGWSTAFDPEDLSQTCINAAAKGRHSMPDMAWEVSIVFSTDARMRELNRDWRKIDKPTNVLSFPAPHPGKGAPVAPLGDIILGLETVKREAAEQGKTFRDHTAHLIVHGFLHLIGYDHETDNEAEHMEGEEVGILAAIGISNPYDGDWRPETAA
jgi:probable rRNA maturation factor